MKCLLELRCLWKPSVRLRDAFDWVRCTVFEVTVRGRSRLRLQICCCIGSRHFL